MFLQKARLSVSLSLKLAYFENSSRPIKFKEFRIWHYRLLERIRAFIQLETESEYDLKTLFDFLKSTPFKGKFLSTVGIEHINRLILYDISPIVSEEEVYSLLKDVSKGFCGITLFDTVTLHGVLSSGVCLIEYSNYSAARLGMLSIIQRHAELRGVLSPSFKVMWAEPLFDYSCEFALYSKAIEVKNIPLSCSSEKLCGIFKKFGTILKIRRYSTYSVVYFSKASEAKSAFESLMEFELDNGITCKTSMAKITIEDLTEDSPESSSVNMFDIGLNESMGLVQQMIYGSDSTNEILLSKARDILKIEEYKLNSQHQQIPYDNVSASLDTPSFQGKRPPEIERENFQYKKPKLEMNSFTGGNFYDQRHLQMPDNGRLKDGESSFSCQSSTKQRQPKTLHGGKTAEGFI